MPKDYVVEDIQERTRMGPNGRGETYYALTVKTAKGTTFTMRLGEDQIDEPTAQKIIGEKARQLDKLKG